MASKVIVLSLHKAGTNLISEIFQRIGYSIIGEGIGHSYDAVREIVSKAKISKNDPNAVLKALLDQTPSKSAIFIHQITLPSTGFTPAPFFDEWTVNCRPPIVFNYRDPRAVCSSLVRYLSSSDAGKVSKWPWGVVQRQVLSSIDSHSERLDYAIEHFGDHFHRLYADHIWALKHPAILKARYEDLVGPAGGGDLASQRRCISQISAYLDLDLDLDALCASIYNPAARTFKYGQADHWKREFDDRQVERFAVKYGELLRTYGYEEMK